jgi:hypothetical protein
MGQFTLHEQILSIIICESSKLSPLSMWQPHEGLPSQFFEPFNKPKQTVAQLQNNRARAKNHICMMGLPYSFITNSKKEFKI